MTTPASVARAAVTVLSASLPVPISGYVGRRRGGKSGRSGKGPGDRAEGGALNLFPSRGEKTPEVLVLFFPCEILSLLRGPGREMQGLSGLSPGRLAALRTAS